MKPEIPEGTNLEEVLHHNNLGVAHLEQHHYGEALAEFERVVEAVPGWADGHLNLAVAALSLHENERAAEEVLKALEISPKHPHAHYTYGLILKQEGRTEEALQEFGRVLEVDPGDADTHYNMGLLLAREGRHQEALEALRKTLDIQPLNVSAKFRLASSLLAVGKKEEGNGAMEEFKALNASGVGITMGLQYTEQGKYSLAVDDYRAFGLSPVKGGPATVRFQDVSPEDSGISFVHGGAGGDPIPPGSAGSVEALLCSYGPGVAASDFDSDGDVDLLVPNCAAEGLGAAPALLRNDGAGRFEDAVEEAGLSAANGCVAAAFGDYDNDGHRDLYLTCLRGNRLYRSQGDGTFEDVTSAAGVQGAGLSLAPAWADADHDGDLDLVVSRVGLMEGGKLVPAPLLFFNNNGNGTFTEVAAEKKTDRPLSGVGVIFGDLDDDRDIDFVVSTASEPVTLFENERGGTFTPMAEEWNLPAQGKGDGAILADLDSDGWTDLFLPRVGWFRNREGSGFEAQSGIRPDATALGSAVLDYDNDGDFDLAVAGRSLTLLENDGEGNFSDVAAQVGLDGLEVGAARGMVAADFDGDGDSDLALARNGAAPLLMRNDGGNLRNWIRVELTGLRSNRFGVGTKVEVHAGSHFQREMVRLGGGYLSQGPETLVFGLGERKLADFVRVRWPGGVLQSEMEVSARQTLATSELDRKGSSCPIIFAWDGTGYRFITDFLGVGGIGFWTRPGFYGQPDPDEFIKIEAEELRERDGHYPIQILENLEEITYLDEAKLWVVDHPAETRVFPNERFGGGGPPPFALFSYRKPIFPVAAWDDGGRDVRSSLMKVDRSYPDAFGVRKRLPGFAEEHSLTLDFGPALRDKRNLVLFLYGWTEYGYSSTNLAASQAGIVPQLPRLEVMGADGRWDTLIGDMGYPAGLPRMMTVDLRDSGPFVEGRFRITTNLRVYWDQVFMAEVDEDAATRITKISPERADLHVRGYPREYSPDGSKPLVYDYALMDPTFPFRNMEGDYTRLGSVNELLSEADDRFVIFGRGEELTLEFPVRDLPPLPAGWRRDFILYANGYCKDMDPNTAYPDTVEPLPFHAMSAYPYPVGERYPDDPLHLDYLRRYNTRWISGRP